MKWYSNLKMRPIHILLACFILFSCSVPGFAQGASKESESLFVAKKAFEDGFYDVSLGLLERFLKNYPNSPKAAEAQLLVGQCYFHQNRFLDSLNKFEELSNQSSAKDIKDSVLYWIGEVHFKGNNFDKSAKYYSAVIEQFPKSEYVPAAYYSLGWSLFQQNKFEEALKYFKVIEEKFPKNQNAEDASFKIIECFYNLKDYRGLKDKSATYLKQYAKDAAKLPYFYFYLAEAEYYLNNFSDAIDGYAKVIASGADDKIQGLSKLGKAWSYLKLKRYKEADDAFFDIKDGSLDRRSADVLLLGKAILMVETNRVNDAKDLYEELIKTTQDPAVQIQAYMGKADALYNLADYDEAVKVYKEAIAKSGSESLPGELADKLHYALAWVYLKRGEFKEAIQEFQKIVKSSDDKIFKISALCQIGDAYQDSGDYLKAQETYDTILKDYPDSFYGDYVQYQLGLSLLKSSNYDGAILSFLTFRKNFPQSKLLDDVIYALGLAYFQKQDYNSSRETFDKFQGEFQESSLKSQALYLLGTSLYNLEKFPAAIEAFKNVIRLYSQNTELVQKAEYEIADCYYQMGNELEAMNRFTALRAKYPDSTLTPEIMWWLGEYYYRHNDLNLARRYFSSLIQDFSKSSLVADSYYALASCYEQEGKHEEALENFKKVIESTRSDLMGQAAIAIADIYAKQDKPDVAIGTYQGILKSHPNLANAIYPKLADLYYKMGNYTESLSFYRKSLDMVPAQQIASIQLKIAETLEVAGKFDSAVEEYLKVTYLYPDKKDLVLKALLRSAAIYEEKENYKEAITIYHKILGLKVEEGKFAQERLDWIKANVK